MLLGLDSTNFRIYDKSFTRLMVNWKLIGWVSVLGGIAYAVRPADTDGDQLQVNPLNLFSECSRNTNDYRNCSQAQCPGYLIIFITLCVQV